MIKRRPFLLAAFASFTGLVLPKPSLADIPPLHPMAVDPWAKQLIIAARGQIGVTTLYDPAYVRLTFPGGDVPLDRGVCTDVVIRAYRALKFDLQLQVNKDMRAHFAAYTKRWGLKRPDANIDHRRVDNLRTFFQRKKAELNQPKTPLDWLPGDVVSIMLPGNLPHIGIVSDQLSADAIRPMVIHNIGRGTQEEDILGQFEITGRYRFSVTV